MVVSFKDSLKFVGVTVIIACAVFVCTVFAGYALDLSAAKSAACEAGAEGAALYNAQMTNARVVCACSGGCLAATSFVMLIFYTCNYIDSRGEQLGVLKALGYTARELAPRFCVFGFAVFIGAVIGFCAGYAFMPLVYVAQTEGLPFSVELELHLSLIFYFIALPTVFFGAFSAMCAYVKLRRPALDLIKGTVRVKAKPPAVRSRSELPFLSDVALAVLRERKALAFFMAFSSFCFAAMTQMSFTMSDLSGTLMAVMTLVIGLTLAFTSLTITLSSAVKANAAAFALLKINGYTLKERMLGVFGAYVPFLAVGFALGSAYQYILLKIMVQAVFADLTAPDYSFGWGAFAVSLAAFAAACALFTAFYARKADRVPLGTISADE